MHYWIFYITLGFIGQVLWGLFTCWMCAVQYEDYAFDNHKIDFKQMKDDLKAKQGVSYGFGFAVMLLTAIPFINLIVMPICCVIMLTEPLILILALTLIAGAAALQSLLGFGLGVIATPILVLINPAFIPAPILLLGLGLSLLSTLNNKKNIQISRISITLYGRFR